MQKLLCSGAVWALVLAIGTGTAAQPVSVTPTPDAPFGSRWNGAMVQARSQDDGVVQVGFEIRRLMSTDGGFISTDSWTVYQSHRNSRHDESLYELIEGERPPRDYDTDEDAVRRTAKLVLAKMGNPVAVEKADRRVGIVFTVDTRGSRSTELTSMWIGTLEMPFERKGRNLYWLGRVDAGQSVPFLAELLASASGAKTRKRLIAAIGVHSDSELVVPVIAAALRDDPSADSKEEAASWLAFHTENLAMGPLKRAVMSDESPDVREEAVESIANFYSDEATKILMDVARTDQNAEVREEAVEALSSRHDERVTLFLYEIAMSDRSSDVAESAVETLARHPAERSVPALSKVARAHGSADVREEALEALAYYPTSESILAIARVAEFDVSADVQEEAMEILMKLPDGRGVDILFTLARTHPRASGRKAARELLDESPDADVRALLDEPSR